MAFLAKALAIRYHLAGSPTPAIAERSPAESHRPPGAKRILKHAMTTSTGKSPAAKKSISRR